MTSPEPNDVLRAWRKTLPAGVSLKVRRDRNSGWYLDMITVPPAKRGLGSEVLAGFLALADAAGQPVRLRADPSDEPGDPDTLTLVRWYQRFGFVPTRPHDDGVDMARPCQVPQPAAAILDQASANRDLTWSEATLTQWRDAWTAQRPGVPPPRIRRRP